MAVKSSVATTADWWPPGFRFHPTDEELILYWLKRKICRKRCKLDIVGEVDVYKCEPEELPGLSLLKTGDRQWFFFSPRDRKYPNGLRSNRGTKHGYWKATGKDRNITSSDRTVGIKKTLVFYKGRAPNGERTDWVMHEYTLDENELKRCVNIQDYYALYKVFKKSGPGPKNGEQYGAPFREEDWDNDLPELTGNSAPTVHVKQSNASAAECDNTENQANFTWADIEECMKRLADEPLPGDAVVDHNAVALPQVLGEDDSSVSDMSFARAASVDPQALFPSFTQHNLGGNDNSIFSSTSQFPLHDATHMPSTDVVNLNRHVVEDDFLEMDDLLAIDPGGDMAEYLGTGPSDGKYLEPQLLIAEIQENNPWGELDGLSEADLYHEVFQNMGNSNEAATGDFSLKAAEVRQPLNLAGFEEETPSYVMNNWSGNDAESFHAAAFQSPGPATQSNSGVVCGGGNFTPNAMELHENKNGSGKGVEGAENWYTSALWSFVESIPTTPASAADSALINKALGRMSSFNRLRLMNTKSTATTNSAAVSSSSRSGGGASSSSGTCSHGAVRKETGGGMKGFFLLSFLGALFAILFMFSSRLYLSSVSYFST